MKKDYPYHPLKEGVDHINAYSRSSTWLGRNLSNFAECSINTRFGRFKSVEGFWYWLSTGKIHNKLKDMHGFEAKDYGRTFAVVEEENFESYVKEAITYKFFMNPMIKDGLVENNLKLAHYYYYGKPENPNVQPVACDWMLDHMQTLNDLLVSPNIVKCVVAGTRSLRKKENIRKLLRYLGMRFEIVSGLANGPDKDGLEIAKEEGWPYKKLPAEWEKYGKAAGMIRNKQMGEYMDMAIVIWDGVSPGTSNMISVAHALNKPVLVIISKD